MTLLRPDATALVAGCAGFEMPLERGLALTAAWFAVPGNRRCDTPELASAAE
jgi:hypothetical protein